MPHGKYVLALNLVKQHTLGWKSGITRRISHVSRVPQYCILWKELEKLSTRDFILDFTHGLLHDFFPTRNAQRKLSGAFVAYISVGQNSLSVTRYGLGQDSQSSHR